MPTHSRIVANCMAVTARCARIAQESAGTRTRRINVCTGVPSARSHHTHHPLHQLISARVCCRLHLEHDRLRVLDRSGAARPVAVRGRRAENARVVVPPRGHATRVSGLPADAPHVPRMRRKMMPSSMRALRDPKATSLTRGAHGRRVPGLWERAPGAHVQKLKKVVSVRKKTTL